MSIDEGRSRTDRVGVPASGKSTWAYRNAPSAIVVSQDDLIDAITPSGFDYSARPIYSAAEEAVARTALSMGRSVIVDRTNRTRALRRRWLAVGQEAGCPAIAIVMSCDFDTCRRRNRERSDPRRVSEERMERMISAFEDPTISEGFTAVVDCRTCQTVSDACRLAKFGQSQGLQFQQNDAESSTRSTGQRLSFRLGLKSLLSRICQII